MKSILSALVCFFLMGFESRASVKLERVPGGGLQPEVVASRDGTLHLVCLSGDPKASDVQYYARPVASVGWSEPLRVNSQPGSAIAIGTIRGAQIAIGRQGRVHVVWNGSNSADPKPALGGTPLLYTYLDPGSRRFVSQRNVMQHSSQLDGGGSVAADSEGRVYVLWHGAAASRTGETNRAVFLAFSSDDGLTLSPERMISPPNSGACGCCGLTATTTAEGSLLVLFRGARSLMERDMNLLVSADHGQTFEPRMSDAWAIGACPMSSAGLAGDDKVQWAAWETAGRIQLLRAEKGRWQPQPRSVGPLKGAKHPRVATNLRGETLVVWTEGTGWKRGGSLAWQIFDAAGVPTAESGKQEGIPAWSYACPAALSDGTFAILY